MRRVSSWCLSVVLVAAGVFSLLAACDTPAEAQLLNPPQVLLEVHPNERAQSATGGPSIGTAPWAPASLASGPWYKWKKYVFGGSSDLWIQVCAQCFDKTQTGAAESDKLQMRIDGLIPSDWWGIQSGPSGTGFDYQWKGGLDRGDRVTLEFFLTGLTPGSHLIDFRADGTPVIWWVKVTDMNQRSLD
jgi:hypothetical protein